MIILILRRKLNFKQVGTINKIIILVSIDGQYPVKLGYNELGCFQTVGYDEQIFRSNWSF